jgi:hypothetical protein
MDLNGNVINVYDLVQGFNEGKLYQSAWITDSTLIGSAGWHNGSSGPQESKVVKFDTLGNILQTRTILASEYLCYVKKTIDGKFLFYTMRNNSGNPSIPFHNTYLFKLNGDLNFDSLNTQPKLYDSLCDQIAFQDTIIVNNCDITLTIDKTEQIIERSKLLLYPNPANQFLKIQLPDYICSTSKKGSIKLTSQNFKYKSNSYLRIYNITGIIIYQKKLSDSDQIIAIDLSEITQGTYFAAIYSQETNSETAKFIISR